MRLLLNGQSIETDAATLLALLQERGIDTAQPGIAAAVNGEVVPRASWEGCALEGGEDVEVITAMQGG